MILDYTYVINRNIFHNYAIHENTINSYDLQIMLNGTSNEYDLQSVYNANGFIGIITELQQVCLAIHDTDIIQFSYTGSENIDITNNQISLNLQMKINNEILFKSKSI